MFRCSLCNKKFKYESKLNEHNNRKNSCIEPKKEYKCNLCNVKFISPAQQVIHENTKKHIEFYNNANNQDEFIDTTNDNIFIQRIIDI